MSSAASPPPDFLILGAAKAGTTSLAAYLGQHPEIFMSPVKEILRSQLSRRIRDYVRHRNLVRLTLDLQIRDRLTLAFPDDIRKRSKASQL